MKFTFDGKVALVTGAASGMGLLSAKCLSEGGAKVCLVDIDAEALDAVRSEFSSEVLLLPCDIRHFDEVEAAVKRAVDTFGRIDVLINCAGGNSVRMLGSPGAFCDRPMADIEWGIDVNLMGTLYFCHEVMRLMRDQKSGSIINLGSITGIEGDTSGIDYAISKSAIMNGMNKSLAKYGAAFGVRVNCVAPGPVLTRPGMAAMKTPLGRAAEPQELVDMILYLASDESSFVTGSTFLMDGGRHLMMADMNS